MPRFASAASALLGAALAAAAFVARGGSDLGRVTAVEIALVLVGGILLALAAARGRLGEGPGTLCAALFALLAVLTAASITWSIAPDLSWVEANRTLAYAAVFAAGVAAARLAPESAPVLLRGVLVAAALVVGYSLLSRVFPAALAGDEVYARIAQPYDYWNAVGVSAALAIPGALWLGARRSGHAPANALAYPLMGLLLVALFLSYSRGALAAAVAGGALWLLWVPLRLRSLAVLALPAAAAAPVIAWALSKDAFTKDGMPLAAREAVAGEFGLLLLGMLVALTGAGLAIGFRLSLQAPTIALRRRLGVAALGAAGAVALFAFVSVAVSEPGLAGTVSGRIQEVTSDRARTSGGPERLTQTSSSRAAYWRQAARIHAERPSVGRGAGTFGLARLRYRGDQFSARHAHGYIAQTLSDLGFAGLAVSLALALAWSFAAARAVGLGRQGGDGSFDPDRVALAALALTVIVFGLHSTIDWTWFVPGPTLMAVAAAGFVAGRGPRAPVAVPAARAAPVTTPPPLTLVMAPAPPPAAEGHGNGARPATPAATQLSVPGEEPELLAPARRGWPAGQQRSLALATAVLVTTVLCVWAIWQPARSEAHSTRALEQIEAGRLPDAGREAELAARIDRLSSRPLLVKAAVEGASGRDRAALALLERAVREHPSDPQVWLRLASFQLRTLRAPDAALETLRGALYIDPQSRQVQPLYYEARAVQRERATAREGARVP